MRIKIQNKKSTLTKQWEPFSKQLTLSNLAMKHLKPVKVLELNLNLSKSNN